MAIWNDKEYVVVNLTDKTFFMQELKYANITRVCVSQVRVQV